MTDSRSEPSTPQASDTLADRLRIAFTDSGISIGDIATACHTSVQAVYKWLDGRTADLAGQNLAIVVEKTGYSPQWIEFGTGPRILVYAKSQRAATVLAAMERLTERQAAALEQIALSMTSNYDEPAPPAQRDAA